MEKNEVREMNATAENNVIVYRNWEIDSANAEQNFRTKGGK